MENVLSKKLADFASTLNESERANYKLILALAASGVAPDFIEEESQDRREVFDAVCKSLTELQPYANRITGNGIAWRGRPSFITDALLKELQREARELRKDAIIYPDHSLGCGAPAANALALSDEMRELVSDHAGPVLSTGIASFIFYDQAGQGIKPHIDTDIFSLNTLIMLDHKSTDRQRSRLVLFPPEAEKEEIALEPGEMIIFFAGSVMHGREPLAEGESVTILTLGFHPLGI